MDIFIYDSVKKQKVKFEPIEEKKAKVYVCGPTVYDDSHLGHARSAIVFDLLHRVLKANGYEVTMTKNFTDIDDKILKKMKSSGKSLEEITTYYIDKYKEDMNSLNVLPNTLEPKATKNLDAMIGMINSLLEKGSAYIIKEGVYFDTSKDVSYGSLSKRFDDGESVARVEENTNKKNQKDFALWKFNDEDEVSFEAPFGSGRPGWHIECSAMIERHIAGKGEYAIDIHGGGADLLFPHHENEAAQTRCAKDQELAKYWMHNGFVNIDGEKMSKSLGNSFFLKDALKNFDGEVIRFYMMSASYRADFSFSEDDLIAAKKRLDKIYRLKKRVYGGAKSVAGKDFKKSLTQALNDDLNTPKALSVVDEFIAHANEKLDSEPKNKGYKKEIAANLEFINELLGVGSKDAFAYFQFGIDEQMKDRIETLILQRNEAKKEKDFTRSDAIRDELNAMSISIMDTPGGTLWEKINN